MIALRWSSHGHGLLFATVFVVVASQTVLLGGLVAGFVGCWFGSVLAASWSSALQPKIRVGVALLLVVGGWAAGAGLTWLYGPARVLGLGATLQLAEALQCFGAACGLVFALRSLTAWSRGFLIVEVVLIVASIASLVSAHRDGMIARPLALADALWRRGIDPVVGLLAVGGLATLAAAASLSKGRNGAKVLLRLATAALLILGVGYLLNHASVTSPLPERGGSGPSEVQLDENGEPVPGSADSTQQLERPELRRAERRPMAVVVLKRSVEPVNRVFYFREASFSHFNAVRLVEPDGLELPWGNSTLRYFPLRPMQMEVPLSKDRVAVAYEVSLLQDHGRPFLLADPSLVEPRSNPNPARFRRSYKGVSNVVRGGFSDLLGHSAGEESWSVEAWQELTEIPDDPRYLELSQRIIAGLPARDRQDPLVQAFAVKRYLEQSTIYTFDVPFGFSGLGTGDALEDPVGAFLFQEGDLRGFCTHIAHSAALLLRALNVPSRVSSGYAIESGRLQNGSALLVLSGDAHAWLEIYLSGVGWLPIEITPERVEEDVEPPEVQDLQQLLGEMAREEGAFEPEPVPSSNFWPKLFRVLGTILPWFVAAAVGGAYSIRPLTLGWSLLRPEAVRPAYQSAIDELGGLGFVRARGESREAFAQRMYERSPSLVALTDLLMAGVLGGKRVGRIAGGRTAAKVARSVRSEIGGQVPIWRRFLGWCVPSARLWSR